MRSIKEMHLTDPRTLKRCRNDAERRLNKLDKKKHRHNVQFLQHTAAFSINTVRWH